MFCVIIMSTIFFYSEQTRTITDGKQSGITLLLLNMSSSNSPCSTKRYLLQSFSCFFSLKNWTAWEVIYPERRWDRMSLPAKWVNKFRKLFRVGSVSSGADQNLTGGCRGSPTRDWTENVWEDFREISSPGWSWKGQLTWAFGYSYRK